jgi:hypothetical protein
MHGGTIRVESGGAAQGSEFIIELPVSTHAAAAIEPPHKSRISVIEPQGARVLVVDDNTDAAEMLTQASRQAH